MSRAFAPICILFICLTGCVRPPENALPEYPLAISIENNPSTVSAVIDPEDEYSYYWQYATSVRSPERRLKVVEFGGCISEGGYYLALPTIYERPFNSQEFADWYGCEEAILEPGVTYTDSSNYNLIERTLFTNDGSRASQFWYFIGEDGSGERYIGFGEITLINSLTRE